MIKDSLTTLMLTISEKGFGKRTPLAEYRITSRGGKGVINLKTTDRNGGVVAALQVAEESDVMIIAGQGKVIRVHSNEIREQDARRKVCACCGWTKGTRIAAAAALLEEEAEAVAEPKEPPEGLALSAEKLWASTRICAPQRTLGIPPSGKNQLAGGK